MAKLPDFNNTNFDDDKPVYFFGEMVRRPHWLVELFAKGGVAYIAFQCFKDMYNDYTELRELKETADILAGMDHWTNLYDEEQLAKNEVPVYSITYVDDMYVDFDLARKTASKIRNCKQFITNAVYHNGCVFLSLGAVSILFGIPVLNANACVCS